MRTQEADVSEVQEAVPPRRAVAERRPRVADREAGVGPLRDGPQLRQQDVERDAVPADEPRRLHARRRSTLEELPIEDRWILSRLATTTQAVTAAAGRLPLQRGGPARSTTSLVGVLRLVHRDGKGRLKRRRRATGRAAQRVLVGVLDGILRLVQPVMPFVAESLWQALNEAAPERGLPTPAKAAESVVIAAWPSYPAAWVSAAVETRFARMQELVRGVREVAQPLPGGRQDAPRRGRDAAEREWRPTSTRWRRSSARSRGSPTSRPGRTPPSRSRPAASCGRSSRRTCRSRADRRGRRDQAAGEADRGEAEVSSTARRRSSPTRSSWRARRPRWCSSSASWWPTSRSRSRRSRRT